MTPWIQFRRVVLTAGMVICLGLFSQAFAQRAAQQQAQADRGGLNPEAFYGKESFQGVSVRDSLEAIKKLEDARRMERLRDWNKAADWYQEVLEKYGQYVVPSRMDKERVTYQYTGIERPVQEQLAKWDPEGLAAYKSRYGAIADTMLATAGRDDRETLAKIMKLYFVTDAGKNAGIRLMDLLLEGGDFAEAARIGDRLLDWHPNLKTEIPRVLFRTALAYHLSGDQKKSQERAHRLSTQFAEATGTVFGRDVSLAQSLDRLLQHAPPVAIQTRTNSIRYNPGGNEERSMISAARGRPGARMASIELLPPIAKPDANMRQQMQQWEQMQGRRDTSGSSDGLGIMPVVDDDEMFFHDGSRIYAVSLASGVPLPGWMQSYPNSNGTYTINSISFARNQQHSLTVTDNCVLAIMGATQRVNMYGAMPVGGSDQGSRIVCLQRANGKEKWVARPKQLPDENLRSGLEFSGSPLVVGDNVYVIGRGGRNYTEDCYVLCFDLNSGSYKWSCFIASASNGNMMYMGGMPTTGDTLSHLAYSSGRIYVLTNLGACAAIDAYAGNISWLNIYPRDIGNADPNMMGFQRLGRVGSMGSAKAWEFNPVIVQDGKVFILPLDGRQNVLVYDAGTGEEVKRIALTDVLKSTELTPSASPTTILGVDGKELFLAGGNVVFNVDWAGYERGKDPTIWRSVPFVRPVGAGDTPILGRGFVTRDSVLVTTELGLQRIDRRTAKLEEGYPGRGRTWDRTEGEGPGNVLVTDDRVVIAGAKRVNVYADMVLARKRLDDDVAAAPGDPEPRLRYAEVMFVAGQLPVAMEKLDETVGLLGGLKALRQGNERDHFFNDCITFATKLQREKKPENIESVDKLYDLAAAAADSDSQQVNYRMSRAKFNVDFEQTGSLENAVKLYQEILLSPRLRTVPLSDPQAGGTTQAALAAEKFIADIKKNHSSAYDAFEKQAADALTSAGADPAKLKSVAECYPNSASAPKAMIGAAEAYEKQGASNPEGYKLAAYTLRQVYTKYGDSADRVRILESMARNYLAMPDRPVDRIDTAAARLSTAVKLGKGEEKLAHPLNLAGKKVLAETGTSINQALKAIQTYKIQSESARLPDFKLPPKAMVDAAHAQARAEWEKAGRPDDKKPVRMDPFIRGEKELVVDDVSAIVSPPRELRDQHARHDVLGTWTTGNFVLYKAGTSQVLGQSNAFASQPTGLAWIGGNSQVLVWSDNELALFASDALAKKWKIDLKNLPRIEVIAGAADQTVAAGNPNADDVVMVGNGIVRRRIFRGGVMIGGGGMVQPAPAVVQAGGPEKILWVKPVDDRVIVATSAGQLFSVKLADGMLAWQTRLGNNVPIDRMVATDDFVACKVTDSSNTQIVALDTLDGRLVRRWAYPNDSGNVPVNLALAPDGMLVWARAGSLCGKDLFEPRKELNYETAAGTNDPNRNPNVAMAIDGQMVNAIFAGATQPDQLLISEGRVIVVTHNGKFASLYSLESGKLLDWKTEDGRRAEARFSTVIESSSSQPQINDWGVALRTIGSYLYITSRSNCMAAYNLDPDHAGQKWPGSVDVGRNYSSFSVQFQDALVGQDYVFLFVQPLNRQGAAAQRNPNYYRLQCYTRMLVPNKGESGCLVFTYDLRDDAGISDFEGVEGGIYYLSGDKKLHFLKGSRP